MSILKNCPNCGAPIEPYKCKCEYCGTWYFDFTGFNMDEDVPCYIRFKTQHGIITTFARPELKTIDIQDECDYVSNAAGYKIAKFTTSRNCDLGVIFHTLPNQEDGSLFKLEIMDKF